MPEVVDSFATPGGNTWEKRVDSRGIEYAVASHKSNKQKVSSFNAAKAGAASARSRKEKYGTAQPGKNDPQEEVDSEPIEPPEEVGFDITVEFRKVEVSSDRSRTSPYDDLDQRKAAVGLPLDEFQVVVPEYADRMADIQITVLEAVADEYWTHCNWGAELEVTSDSKMDSLGITISKAVSTTDVQANNIFPNDMPETYHPRHTNHPGTNTDPGTNFRFIQLIDGLSDQAYEETTVKSVWVELLKYPSDTEEEADQ